MKLVYCPKPYYSMLSSLSMLILSLYLIYRQKMIGYFSTIVSIVSLLYHCRSHFKNILKIMDVLFTVCLGLILFTKNNYNRIILGLIFLIYLNIFYIFAKASRIKSILHMVIHILVMHMLFNELNDDK